MIMNLRRTILALGSILALGAPAVADYGADPSTTYGVDIQQGYPSSTYNYLPNVVGSGAYLIANHHFDQVLAFNLSGTITGLTLSGDLTDLRHISAGGDESWPTYASQGISASFNMSVAVIPAPPSFDPTGLGTTIDGLSSYAGFGSVDDGIGDGAAGPGFSITLGDAAVAAANQAIAAGDAFYLVLSGSGYASFDSSLEGDLSPVTLDVQTAFQPSFFAPTPVPEPSTLALLVGGLSVAGICGRFRGRTRRAGPGRSPRGTPMPRS
jgi:hypothetical protein